MYLILWLFLICISTSCFAEKLTISQDPLFIVKKIGQEVQMNCKQITTNHDWMYWYLQMKGQAPRLIAYMSKVENEATFEGSYKDTYEMGKSEDTHRYLKIKSLTSHAQKLTISQTPSLIVNTTGQEVLMSCKQLTTNHDWMYWYYQAKGEGLQLIAKMLKGQPPDYEGTYKNTSEMGSENDKQSSLKIKSLTALNSGVYFCASSDAQ